MARPRLQPGEHGSINVRLNPSSASSSTKWKASARHRDGMTGVVAQRSASGPTQAEARRRLLARLEESAGARNEARTMTLQAAAREWLEATAKLGRWQPTTLGTYRRAIESGLSPVAGLSLAEASANPRAIRTFIRDLALESKTRGRRMRTILRQTFAWAVDEGLISGTNPLASVAMPRADPTTAKIVEADDLAELLRVADLGPWYVSAGVRVMVGAGLRIGEMLALRVGDVAFVDGGLVLSVAGSVIEPEGEPVTLRDGRAKSNSSLRRLYVGGVAAEALLALVNRAGSAPSALLFAGRGGVVKSPRNWRRAWRAVRSQSPVTAKVHPHQLRATYATLSIREGGWSAETTAGALGHAGTAVLFAHYFRQAPIRGLPSPSSAPSAPQAEITA